MRRAPRFSGMTLMLLLALTWVSVAQSNSGSEPAPTQGPADNWEPKVVDGERVYKVGHGVTAPRFKFAPSPEYSKEARKAKYQGTCLLWLIVGQDGLPRDIKITRALGKGLDEKAVDAVKKWKFDPAMKDGQPVAVQINVEVSFRLY